MGVRVAPLSDREYEARPEGTAYVNIEHLLADRTKLIDASGIRRVFECGAKLKDKIDFSIGQPNFPVADTVKEIAEAAGAPSS